MKTFPFAAGIFWLVLSFIPDPGSLSGWACVGIGNLWIAVAYLENRMKP